MDALQIIELTKQKLAVEPHNLGLVRGIVKLLLEQGNYAEAIYYLCLITQSEPNALDYYVLADTYKLIYKLDLALENYLKAIKLDPNFEFAYFEIANIKCEKNEFVDAIHYFSKVLEINPNNLAAKQSLVVVLFSVGNVSSAVVLQKEILLVDQSLENKQDLLSNLIFMQAHDINSTRIEMLNVADMFKDFMYQKLSTKINLFSLQANQRFEFSDCGNKCRLLRIGFVFPFFYNSIAPYFLDLLKARNREEFQYYCFATNPTEDHITIAIKNETDVYINIAELSDEEAAQLVLENEVDILVDMRAHVTGHRLGVFALKPAPIQISFYDCIEPIGLPQIDYILNNTEMASGSSSDIRETKQLLMESFPLYFPLTESHKLLKRIDSWEKKSRICFLSLNRFEKLNDQVLHLWARLLALKPDSDLLFQASVLSDFKLRQNIINIFKTYGVDASRLIFQTKEPLSDFLLTIASGDIALSPFPFPGVTTTFHILSQGVPVIVMDSVKHKAAKAATAMLKDLELDEFIAKDEDDYINKTLHFADKALLEKYRPIIIQKIQNASFVNPFKFQKAFEATLKTVWLEHFHKYNMACKSSALARSKQELTIL